MEQLDTLFGAPRFLFHSRYFHQFCHTSEQRNTQFIHLGDDSFLTQLLYENTVTVLEQLVSTPPSPEFRKHKERQLSTKSAVWQARLTL